MTVAVKPKHEERFMELARKHDVESTIIGKYTDTGKIHIMYDGKTCAYINTDLLKTDFPQWEFDAEWTPPELRGLQEPVLREPKKHNELLLDILSRPNIASKEWIVRQYDHEVQGGSVIKPLVGQESDVVSDAVVLRPILESYRGLAATQALNPTYSEIDAYHMVACTIDEAVRRLVAVGAGLDHIGGVDNFCWPSVQFDPHGNPDGRFKAAQLVRANWALRDFCLAYGIPLLSGKDSMYIDGNLRGRYGETHKVSGLPTLQFTANGVIDDVRKCVTMDAKIPGDLVYVLGQTRNELGGSEYYARFGYSGLNVPHVNAEGFILVYRALSKAVDEEIIASAHGIYRGGLGVHAALVAMAGCLGLNMDLSKVPVSETLSNDRILYSESSGRFIVTIAPENKESFQSAMEGLCYSLVGVVTEDKRLIVTGKEGSTIIDLEIVTLKKSWKEKFGGLI
jgi:phosphoribosylformylglycinamidine synthase